MIKYDFGKGKWDEKHFRYVYGLACTEFKTFTQETDCIRNKEGNTAFGYEYVSMVTEKKYKSGVKFSTKCTFHKFGAPLLVLTDDIFLDEAGHYRYGLHFEVVAFEEGCNVWRVRPSENADNPVEATLLAQPRFPIADGSTIELCVEVEGQKLKIKVNDEYFETEHLEIPEEFHLGLTACEGINCFYHLIIEE